jgi:hypothetical protein
MNSRPFTRLAIAIFAVIAVLHLLRACVGWDISINGMHVPPVLSFGISTLSGLLALRLWRELRVTYVHIT